MTHAAVRRLTASPTAAEAEGKRKPTTLRTRLRRDGVMIVFALPGMIALLLFHYVALIGNVIAFQDYAPFLGFTGSAWVGLENFAAMASDPAFWHAVINTLEITVLQLLFYFPAPVALALLLNSLLSGRVRRFVQSVVYLPHFIGWVIVVSLFGQMVGGTGVIPRLLADLGVPGVDLMTSPAGFKWLMTAQVIWKDTGWGAIIYLAALLSIETSLYEAASVDGAGPWRRLWHVTLPGLIPITLLLLILRLGQALSVGFEQILLQRDNVGARAGEVLDTYVYFHGVASGQWSQAAAAGLVKGIVGLALVLGANKVAHRFGQAGLYQ